MDNQTPAMPTNVVESRQVARTLSHTYADRIMKPTVHALISNCVHDEGHAFGALSKQLSSKPADPARHHIAQHGWLHETVGARPAPGAATSACATAGGPPYTRD